MKRFAATLLIALLYATGVNATHYASPAQELAPCSIEDKGRTDIANIASMLHSSSLDMPQNGQPRYQRNDDTSPRRPSCSSRSAGTAAVADTSHQIQISLSNSCQKAVAAFRYNRGYYIYTLRHIII